MSTTATASASAGGGSKPPFRARLAAWWHGYELAPAAPSSESRAAPDDPPTSKTPRAPGAPRIWDADRLSAVELIWGKGFIWPGGAEHALWLVKPTALDPAMQVLDLSAGLGGADRAMVDEFGIWITGLEASKELAEAGMEQSTMAGMAKKAPIAHFDPESVDLPEGKYDRVFARETFYRVRFKEQLFEAVRETLKDGGEFLLTDYVLRKEGGKSEAIDRWIDGERDPVYPWSVEKYEEMFQELNLELRVTEDMTETHRELVLGGWHRFVRALSAAKMPPPVLLSAVEEAELWAHRVAALESGDVALYRFVALKKGVGTMADW